MPLELKLLNHRVKLIITTNSINMNKFCCTNDRNCKKEVNSKTALKLFLAVKHK